MLRLKHNQYVGFQRDSNEGRNTFVIVTSSHSDRALGCKAGGAPFYGVPKSVIFGYKGCFSWKKFETAKVQGLSGPLEPVAPP